MSGEMFGDPNSPDRHLDEESAKQLRAGSNHYRAYVGPPDRFDFMGATQFSLMFHLGLRDHHKVLDFGCGSLRLGRLLIPYLKKGGYHGIDPNKWLIEDGLTNELGSDAVKIKSPKFKHNTDFNCNVFDEKFDFIVAQSILTHTGLDLFNTFLESAKKSLKPDGMILFTYLPTHDINLPMPADGWHYPGCTRFHINTINSIMEETPLFGKKLPWYHSVTVWYCASLNADRIPSDEKLYHLTGAVFGQDQFKESLNKFIP